MSDDGKPDTMSGQVNSQPYRSVGNNFKNWGIYMIISAVLIFFVSLAIISSIMSQARSANSISDAIEGLRSAIMSLFIISSVLVAIEYFFILKIVSKSNRILKNKSDYSNLNKARYLLILYIIAQIISMVIGYYFIVQLLDSFQAAGSQTDPDLQELERIIQTAEGTTAMTGFINMIVSGIKFVAIYLYVNWLHDLSTIFRTRGLIKAKEYLEKAQWGALLETIGNLVGIGSDSFGGLLSFAGLVLIIYGFIKGGGTLGEIGSLIKPDQGPNSHYLRKTSSDEPPSEQQNLIKCSTCNMDIPSDSKFCEECGAMVKKQEYTSQQVDYKICSECGVKNVLQNKYCVECGRALGN